MSVSFVRSLLDARSRVAAGFATVILFFSITGCGEPDDPPVDPPRSEPAGTSETEQEPTAASEPEPESPTQQATAASDAPRPIARLEVPQLSQALFVERQVVNEMYEEDKPKRRREVKLYSDNSRVNDGEFVEWYRNGQKYKEGTFVDGREEGEWTFWHENGQVAKQPTYKNGQPHGTWALFREDGTKVEQRSYENGRKHGLFVTYDDTGKQKLLEQTFKQGQLDGTATAWYPSGQMRLQATFVDGKLHGERKEWDEQGNLTVEQVFENGTPVPSVDRS